MLTFNKFLVVTGMVCASGQIYALPLAPGGTVAPGTTATAPSGTPIGVDAVTGTQGGLNDGFNWRPGKQTALRASGNYINAVYIDPVTHDLDFYYQIQNTFTGAANAQNTLQSVLQIADFAGFTIFDVQQLKDPNSGNFFGDGANVEFKGKTTQTITSVSRSVDGSDLTVQLSGVVKPGQNTAVLLIKTNATNFDQGNSTFNWVTAPSGCTAANQATGACGNAYSNPFFLANLEPFAAPEPGFYGMLSLGMGGLFFAVRRRRSAKV